MTKSETDQLFELLRLYFPNNRKIDNKKIRNAWFLLLEPYSPEEVKAALVAYLRSNRNLPDPQDIASRCPSLGRKEVCQGPGLRGDDVVERLRGRWKTLLEARRAAALSATWSEAQAAGMPESEWIDALEAAGLDLYRLCEEVMPC